MSDEENPAWLVPNTREKYARERLFALAPTELTIVTKVRSKWRFVDLETGDVWKAKLDGVGFTRAGKIEQEGDGR
jgi:hypothetical protein